MVCGLARLSAVLGRDNLGDRDEYEFFAFRPGP
jgi:hypothetical protein